MDGVLGAGVVGAGVFAGTFLAVPPGALLAAPRAVLPGAFLAGLLAGLLAAPRAAFRNVAASPAGPNLKSRFGWRPGAICARAKDNTTPIAHRDISRAEPP